MEAKWYKLPDRDRYEVSDEEKPRVRNSKTGTVLRPRPNGTVSLYFNTHRRNVQENPVRLLFAAINGVKVDLIPKDIIIQRQNGEFQIQERSEFCNMLNGRFDREVDTETQIIWLKETEAFLSEQEKAVLAGNFGKLLLFLYSYRKRASMLAAHFSKSQISQYTEIDNYASTAVVRVVDKVRRGVVLTMHPTAALKNEIVKIIKHNKKTVQYEDSTLERIYGSRSITR